MLGRDSSARISQNEQHLNACGKRLEFKPPCALCKGRFQPTSADKSSYLKLAAYLSARQNLPALVVTMALGQLSIAAPPWKMLVAVLELGKLEHSCLCNWDSAGDQDVLIYDSLPVLLP